MSRQRILWLCLLGLALLCLLASARYAYDKGLFGGELGSLLDAVVWAVPIVAGVAAFVGVAGVVKESSKQAVIAIINKRANRIAILVVCFAASAMLVLAGSGFEPPPPPPQWTCEIQREWSVVPADARFCPRDPRLDRRQSLGLVLRRAGDLAAPRVLVARASDRRARSVFVNSSRGGRCSVSGPDSAGAGEARMDLRPECATGGAFEVNLHLCFGGPTPRLEPAQLHTAAELTVIEGASPYELRCEDRTGDREPIAIDAGTADAGAADAGAEPAGACPPWPQEPGADQAWVFVRAISDAGPLTHADSFVAVHVKCEPPPDASEQRGRPLDPCAVSSCLRTATAMTIRGEAPGFGSREDSVVPGECTRTDPCDLLLPRALPARYYRRGGGGDRLLKVSELPAGSDAAEFAALVADDALARSRFFRRPLKTELAATERATGVSVKEQVTRFTEKKLARPCDERCIDDPRLDPAIREVLRDFRRRGTVFRRDAVRPRRPPILERQPP